MGMLFAVTNKKTFTADPVTGRVRVTPEDLNEISDFTLEASPLLVDTIPAWFRVRIDSTDFTDADTAQDIEVYELPTAGVIHAVAICPVTSFTGGSISAYTLSVGITGTLNKYAAAFDVFQAPGNTVFQISSTTGAENIGTTTSIRVAATSTGDDLANATTGAADVYLLMSRLPLPA